MNQNIFFDVRLVFIVVAALLVLPFWRARAILLIALSLVFYFTFAGVVAFAVLLILTLLNYFASMGTKPILKLMIAVNLLSLVFWKMLIAIPPTTDNVFAGVIVPLGFSFFIFEFCHYLIEIHRGSFVRGSLIDFLTFIFFFPTLIAGPIKRWPHFVSQIRTGKLTLDNFVRGSLLVSIGVTYKFLGDFFAAQQIAQYNLLQNFPESPLLSLSIHAVFLCTLSGRIFLDFAGYSYMAIGMSRMLGIEIPPNFRAPYLARNLSEFWERWHISLSTWVRDYIYISLGGSRKGPLRRTVNLILAMVIIGLWHGASFSFLVWGIWHGMGLAIFHFQKRLKAPMYLRLKGGFIFKNIVSRLLTFGWVSIGWVPFFYTWTETLTILKGIW